MQQPAFKVETVRKPSAPKKSNSGFFENPTKKRSHAKKLKTPQGVVDETLIAFMPQNRLATILGFILGGSVPVATYATAHMELALIEKMTFANSFAPILMVLGGLLYSALTVYEWGTKAFEHKGKALGYVVLIELTLTLSPIEWLSHVALCLLICINGINTGTKLALKRSIF